MRYWVLAAAVRAGLIFLAWLGVLIICASLGVGDGVTVFLAAVLAGWLVQPLARPLAEWLWEVLG